MTLPRRGKHFRNIALIYGIMLFLWMRLEDFQTLPVVAFGTALAALALLGWLLGRLGGKTISVRALVVGAMLCGGVLGLSSVVTISALMFFKTAIHAHVFPDYPPAQILAMLERAPAWTLAGTLGGLGSVLLHFAQRSLYPVGKVYRA